MTKVATKITKANFLPHTLEGRYPVYSEKFNELVDVINEMEPADGSLQGDIIQEQTAGAGVTVDSVLLKDGAGTFIAPNTYSATATITAFASGGQASATQLTKEYNTVSTVATASDSVKLPVAVLGKAIRVRNSGAKILAIFPATSGTIDGNSADASVLLGPGLELAFEGVSSTGWKTRERVTNAVTQTTSITTGVTLSKIKGLITTVAATAGAAGATPNVFTVTNTLVTTTSNIKAYIVDYAGTFATNGIPIVCVDNRTNGTFDIVIANAHGTNALNGALVIGFEILA